MTALVQAISRTTGIKIDSDSLFGILAFSCIGLAVTLFAIKSYGLDLSYGFF